MKLINPSVELIKQEPGVKGMLKHCELVGRVCYHSENKATKYSTRKFINTQINSGHMSPLEAGTVYLKIPYKSVLNKSRADFFKDNHYSFVTIYNNYAYITTNYRVIVENDMKDLLGYWIEPTEYHMPRICFKIETNIAVYKEMTRHRSLSPMVESTRYCNYRSNKFSRCVSFTLPNWLGYNSEDEQGCLFEYKWLSEKLSVIENIYFEAQEKLGWDAQRASYFLPQGTKATCFFTGFLCDWSHFLNLRYHQITGKVRPDMLQIATKINELIK